VGKDIWHIEVIKRGAVYHGFFNYCDGGTTGNNSLLYFATSPDGITWTVNSTALLSVSAGWDNAKIYRASGCITPTGYDLFYSAMTVAGNAWHIGRTPVTLS
jgi:sucrose-6-phosphate hydrolase SacC (GH32 family)